LASALAPYVADALRAGWLLDTVAQPDAEQDLSLEEFQELQYAGNGDIVSLTESRPSPPQGTSHASAILSILSEPVATTPPKAQRPSKDAWVESPNEMETSFGHGSRSSPDTPSHAKALDQWAEEVAAEDEDVGGTESKARMSAQIERLTDALVRASQKSNVKEKLLTETSAKLRAVQESSERWKEELKDKSKSLSQAEKLVSKRSEQCRQLYEIVTALEQRLADQQSNFAKMKDQRRDEEDYSEMGVQTEEWFGNESAAAVGAELAAERRSRAAEKAALEARIQRLELSVLSTQSSTNHVHLALFSDIRGRLLRELSYRIPNSEELHAMTNEIEKHLGEFGGQE